MIYPSLLLAACAGDPVAASVASVAIPMPDGVRLAADVIQPVGAAGPVPTVLLQTRYWRSFAMVVPDRPGHAPQGPRDGIADALAAAGYAVVVVDVRGTGASEGAWRAPFSPVEVADAGAVIDWIVAQPWSDGRVGAYGISYEGSTALMAAAAGRPALKAALAREVEWELTDEILAPGGLQPRAFLDSWGQAVSDLDRGRYPAIFPAAAGYLVRGPRPLDDDPEGAALAARLGAREVADVGAAARGVRRPSDPFGASGWRVDELGPRSQRLALKTSPTHLGLWGAWWDAATASGVLRAAVERDVTLVDVRVGAWTHEGDASMAPFGAGTTVSLGEVVAWFDTWLRGAGAPARTEWFEAGRDAWHPASEALTATPRHWALAPDGVLAEGEAAAASAPFTLTPAPEGDHTRWTTGVLRPMEFAVAADAPGATWTSAPLAAELRIAVFAGMRCSLSPSPAPAALAAHLEAVSPDGEVRALTDGAVLAEGPTTPALHPLGATVPAGWALRLRLTGGDPDTFALPTDGPVTWTAERPCTLSLATLAPAPT